MYKDNIHKIWSPEIYFVWMVSQTYVKWVNIVEIIIYIMPSFTELLSMSAL